MLATHYLVKIWHIIMLPKYLINENERRHGLPCLKLRKPFQCPQDQHWLSSHGLNLPCFSIQPCSVHLLLHPPLLAADTLTSCSSLNVPELRKSFSGQYKCYFIWWRHSSLDFSWKHLLLLLCLFSVHNSCNKHQGYRRYSIRAGERAQSVTFLPYSYEDPSLTLQNPCKKCQVWFYSLQSH